MIISLQRSQFYPEGNISSKNECKLKDICLSLENKEPTSQEKLEERTKLRWSETKNLKISIPDNTFFLYVITIKLCTLKQLENIHQKSK